MTEHDDYSARILAEHTAKAAEIDALAAEIVDALTGDWLVEPARDSGSWLPDYRYRYLAGPGGARLSLHRVNDAVLDRVEVLGLFGEYSPAWDEHTRITVAVSRGPATIAREIERRLLPVYLTQLETSQRHVAERDAQRAALAHRAARVREIVGEDHLHTASHMNDADRVHYSFADPDLYGHVELRSGGRSVELHLGSLTYETALLLLAALARRSTLTAGVAA